MPTSALLILALIAQTDPKAPGLDPTPAQVQAQGQPPSPLDVVSALEAALGDAIAKAEPSVVAIARVKDGKSEETTAVRGRLPEAPNPRELPNNAFIIRGFDEEAPDYVASDYGSGVVVGDRGQILTTFHVVKGASRLVVRATGGQLFDAEVIAADPRSDLAIIAPRDEPGRPRPRLRPIAMGDATGLRKGMFLVALGNPFNAGRDGRASASWGILANIARRVDPALVAAPERQLRHYPTMLQLDAKLNLGMSGGAVINLKGEMVGLTTNAANAGGFDSQAGYALPVDTLTRRAIDALTQGREVEYGFLGVELSRDNSNRIAGVKVGTPAGEGGLMAEDEILSIGGLPVTDSDSLVISVNSFTPGTPIKVVVRHPDGEVAEKTVILSKLRISGEVIATNRPTSWRGVRVDFISTDPRIPYGPEILRAMAQGGVLVVAVQPGSAADDAGLKPGQIIVKVEGRGIRTPDDFVKALEGIRGPATLTTEGDRTITVR